MKANYLGKGLPGHPLHPPLTDATIGIYAGATAFGVLSTARAAAPVAHPEKEAAQARR